MRTRQLIAGALGVALITASAAAQDTTRRTTKSDRRVQVSKGEVALPPRLDTLYLTRLDTVYLTRTDTVYYPVRPAMRVPTTIVRVDTVIVPAAPAPIARNPIYAALYTGMTMPSGNVDRLYTNGFHAGAAVGWDGMRQFLGVRLKGEIAQLSREHGAAGALVGTTSPLFVNVGADLKVMPLDFAGWSVYGIGGVMSSSYRGIATVAMQGRGMGNMDGHGGWYQPVSNSSWRSRFGWNVGGGTDIQLGRHEMFIEARAVALEADAARTWFVPISLGLRFF